MTAAASKNSNLVYLWCATAGKNSTDLGTDESQIILTAILVYDALNQSIVVKKYFSKPEVTSNVANLPIISPECNIQTAITDLDVSNAPPLRAQLFEMDNFLKQYQLSEGGFILVTDGSAHLRQCLHPEAFKKNIVLGEYWNKYIDLRKEFKRCFPKSNCSSISEMLTFIQMTGNQKSEFGIKQCFDMHNIIQRLIKEGHTFDDPEVIKTSFEPAICKDTFVDDDTVVRARGLPWQFSDQEITDFFRGLNIVNGGIALCLGTNSKRNGEALVRLESQAHRDMALRRHKHHMGGRYIEVYRASGKEFLKVAVGDSAEALTFLKKGGGQLNKAIVRMRGLPYTTTMEQVIEFFQTGDLPCKPMLGTDGILFVRQPNGRSTGDAFVLFATEEEAKKALTRHKLSIGPRYIELFRSNISEVQQVLTRSQELPKITTDLSISPRQSAFILPQASPLGHMPAFLAPTILPAAPTAAVVSGKNCVRMRGLPADATVEDLLVFLGEFSNTVVFQGVHMITTSEGLPSGEAFIELQSEQYAELCSQSRHNKYLVKGAKQYVIEMFQCSPDDMQYILATGQLPEISLDSKSPCNQAAVIKHFQPTSGMQSAVMLSPQGAAIYGPPPPPQATAAHFAAAPAGYHYHQQQQQYHPFYTQPVIAASQYINNIGAAGVAAAAAGTHSPNNPMRHQQQMPQPIYCYPGVIPTAAGGGVPHVPGGPHGTVGAGPAQYYTTAAGQAAASGAGGAGSAAGQYVLVNVHQQLIRQEQTA